jgi:hypothetical protein
LNVELNGDFGCTVIGGLFTLFDILEALGDYKDDNGFYGGKFLINL